MMKIYKAPKYQDPGPVRSKVKRPSKYIAILATLERGKWAAILEGKATTVHAMTAHFRTKFPGFEFASRQSAEPGQCIFFVKRK